MITNAPKPPKPAHASGETQLARIHESLGAYSLSLAAQRRRPGDWREARRWYQLSLEAFEDPGRRGKLAADYATRPRELERKIRTCDAALGTVR